MAAYKSVLFRFEDNPNAPISGKTSRAESFTEKDDMVHVDFFANEKSLKSRLQLYFIKNRQSSLRIRLFNVLIKLLSCVFYVVRVTTQNEGIRAHFENHTDYWEMSADAYLRGEGKIYYGNLVWVTRNTWLHAIQFTVATVSFAETILVMYISYKGNVVQLFCSTSFMLELFTSVPFIITFPIRPLQGIFIPVFLNCWLAKLALQDMLNDVHRAMQRTQSALVRQMVILVSTLVCLIFTATCGVEHLQRAGRMRLNLFQSFYFVMVTFSTVGYGEFYPDYWASQLYVIAMICVAIVLLPTQLEQLASTWLERKKLGGEYGQQRARAEKHVVLCLTNLRSDVIIDFLNEFYAHPMLQAYFVLILSPMESDVNVNLLLQVPLWADRVILIKGSPLKDSDLMRTRMDQAEACFILASRNYMDKIAADQHTVLRSWAVKDFAPNCPQYVQIFRPENKLHLKHADYVVCEDEFKYALLANNCECPGISTFITLLLHTSRGEEGQRSGEPWHRVYGKHSGNEIYHIRLGQSKFFGEYEGKSFTYASFHAHRKYGVCLVAIQRDKFGSTIQLNPGARCILRASDLCYYMSLTKEELTTFVAPVVDRRKHTVANSLAKIGTVAVELQRPNTVDDSATSAKTSKTRWLKRKPSPQKDELAKAEALLNANSEQPTNRKPSICPVMDRLDSTDDVLSGSDSVRKDDDDEICPICGLLCVEDEYVKGFPPVTPYIGTSATLCYLLQAQQPACCLQLAQVCDHCEARTAKEYDWRNPAIILVADHASNGLYNFIIPLRAHYRLAHDLAPIVLLLEQKPDQSFLDAICWFPMIYWMCGKIENLDHVLRAGITLAHQVIVVNKEFAKIESDEYMTDCNTIVSVQTLYRLFPLVHFITELSHCSNMRFMQFNAKDLYALHQSKVEKKETDLGSNIAYMFRLPFAAGNVFSANMLDTLLYQAFVKDYLIEFVRLLLGIDQALGSGYLSSIRITEDDLWIRTYGRLYQKLCAGEDDIPIGIYRTQRMDDASAVSTQVSLEIEQNKDQQSFDALDRKFSRKYLVSERHEITNLVKCRMENLNIPSEDYKYDTGPRGTISYVIINPSYDLQLEAGDIIYVIKPSLGLTRPTRTKNPRRVLRRSYRRSRRRSGSPASAPTQPQVPASAPLRPSSLHQPQAQQSQQIVPSFTITCPSPSKGRSIATDRPDISDFEMKTDADTYDCVTVSRESSATPSGTSV